MSATVVTSTPTPTPSQSAFRLPRIEAKQVKMKRFLDSLSSAESDQLDMLLAEFFFSCNVPFLSCSSVYFKKFINAMRPAYNPPTLRRLATHLLNRVYDKIQKRNSEATAKMGNSIDRWLAELFVESAFNCCDARNFRRQTSVFGIV